MTGSSLDHEIDALYPGLGGEAQKAGWEAMVRKVLKGEDPASLNRLTADSLTARPLYTEADAADLPALGRAAAAGDKAWDLRTLVDAADPAEANRRVLQDLANGASSVLLALDPADPGRLAVASAGDLALVLKDVILDIAPVALDAGFLGPQAAEWLAAAAKGGPRSPLAFHLDPIGAFARQGRSPGPVQAHVDAAAQAAARLADSYPKASLFLASGAAAHEAGGSNVQELALALASALAYAKALTAAGLPQADAFGRIVLGVSLDGEYIDGVAKARAARLLWNRLAQACGQDAPARIEARSSRRMLAAMDAWTNLLRLTAAGFAAAVGGADAVLLEPFTQPLGPASDLARRQARNIQLLLMEESGLGDVADPAAGAWALERKTLDLAEAAWARFQAIEGEGGALAALRSGALAAEVAQTREAIQADYASGARPILGVTRHADKSVAVPALGQPAPAGAAVPSAALPGADDTCAPLAPIRWSAPFEDAKEG